MKHFGDVTKINGAEVPIVDIVTGGSPCQDLSIAGGRAGLDGERSGLFTEQIRIIKEMRDEHRRQLELRGSNFDIRDIKPRFMVWENVCGVFSSNGGEDFRTVLEECARVNDPDTVIPRPPNMEWSNAGCILADRWSIAWRVHSAEFWGVPQRRRRVALVVDFGGQTAPEILFEREGMSRDIRSGETAEQGSSETSRRDFEGAISFQERAGCDGGVKESSSNTTEPAVSESDVDKVFCIGGGQVNDAMSPSEGVSKCLNTLDDPMKVLVPCYGLDRASMNSSKKSVYTPCIEENLSPPLVARGCGGVMTPTG